MDKINQFKLAMDKYHSNIIYNKMGIFVATTVIILQSLVFYNIIYSYFNTSIINNYIIIFVFITSYLLTDFINGFIHLYMDNNSNYTSLFGPLIAAFHLHHRNQIYKKRPLYKVYFYESGAKLWLPIYLTIVIYIQTYENMSFYMNFSLASIGILSSIAEVSHYCCHNSTKDNYILFFLQKYKIFLSKKHHSHHHTQDNKNYAFLNGSTDFMLNIIARLFFGGYKKRTDLHVKAYIGKDTNNR